uniref:menaquinone-dependent protoporphyrinogen IX dehydrogenase n=1 Tax=Thaumasiovibrio occultus TaxID=1891184 RepID=UPI000B36439B|nr:menaquinone-dependent protoporphyrinogen IX dehydrogenase [Thaumasiovibrio occultus]
MKKVLFAISTRDGQTRKILQRLAEQWGSEVTCDWYDLHEQQTVDLTDYDQVLVAASIRYGKFHPSLYSFIKQNKAALEKNNATFICVNLTARKPGKDLPENSAYIRKFLKCSPWQPQEIAIFAGALLYPRYRWFDKVMIRFIMKITGGETDTSKEVEYTDWEKVRIFGEKVREKLEL